MSQPLVSERQNLILASLSKANFAGSSRTWSIRYSHKVRSCTRSERPFNTSISPRTALISLVGLTMQGQGTEVGMIGAEGFVGVSVVFGRDPAVRRHSAMAGSAEKVGSMCSMRENRKTPLSDVLRRCAMIRLGQIGAVRHPESVPFTDTAVCSCS